MSRVAELAEELKQEAIHTRKLLERLPEEHLDWKPHEKSMSLRQLASHIVESYAWVGPTFEVDGFELDPATYTPWSGKGRAEILAKLDENLQGALKALESQKDECLAEPWTMKVGGTTAFTMPRGIVFRVFMLNHQIHHRGQLDVYLRLKDVPLPQVYGPTADEPT